MRISSLNLGCKILFVNEQATCCPPLANFAQLSMFRFDGLIINRWLFLVNNHWLIILVLVIKVMICWLI